MFSWNSEWQPRWVWGSHHGRVLQTREVRFDEMKWFTQSPQLVGGEASMLAHAVTFQGACLPH